jgi:hypothetical protein
VARQPMLQSGQRHWNNALAVMLTVQAECAAWFAALPEGLPDNTTAAALQEIIDLDLDAIAAIQPPLGYGRDLMGAPSRLGQAWCRPQAAKSWVLAMLAPNRSPRVAAVSPSGGFDTACARRRDHAKSGQRTGTAIKPRNNYEHAMALPQLAPVAYSRSSNGG